MRHKTQNVNYTIMLKNRKSKTDITQYDNSAFTNTDCSNTNYQIIDLFAGIGGIRLGFKQAAKEIGVNVECIYTSEIDKYACQTYTKNFPEDKHSPHVDITKVDAYEIPDFDILLAGFPCQAFSIAGNRGGFEDTRGTYFFDVAKIIKAKRPQAFLLENVKNLVNHRIGKTFATILNVLQNDLGYYTRFAVLNAKYFGVPQNRERVYIAGFLDEGEGFDFPSNADSTLTLGDIYEESEVGVKYYLSDTYLSSLRKHKAKHKAKGNGFGYQIKKPDEVASTLVVGGMGIERNLLVDNRLTDYTLITNAKGRVNREGVRKLTPKECERLQGFPDNWTEGVSDTQRYKQLGNSVAVPVIRKIAQKIISKLTGKSRNK